MIGALADLLAPPWALPLPPDHPIAKMRRGAMIHGLAPRPPVGQTPHAIVHRHDKLVVRHYAPTGPAVGGPPLVLVPSMINRAWILDLEPGRSMVEAMAAAGHATYLVDWGVPGPEDATEDLGYVLHELLHRSLDRICRHARAPRAHVLGYCMGGTLTAMLAALRPARFASLVALAAPVRFAEGGRFRDLSHPDVLDVDKAIAADGLMPPEVMAPVFRLLDPMGNLTKYLGVDDASADPKRLASVMARERWLGENVPLAGAFAREWIGRGYQDDALLDGTWVVRGEAIDLGRIACPTLVAPCARDQITPPAAALPLADAVGGPARVELLETGHIGVVVGSFGPRTFFPLVDRWIREHAP